MQELGEEIASWWRMDDWVGAGRGVGGDMQPKSRPGSEHSGVKHRPDSGRGVATFGGTRR